MLLMGCFYYKTIEEHLVHQDIGEYTSYGIVAIDDNHNIMARESDINTEKNIVDNLTVTINNLVLPPKYLNQLTKLFCDNDYKLVL